MLNAGRQDSVLGVAVVPVVLAGLMLGMGADVRAQSSTTNPYRATFGWEQMPEGA